MIVYTIGHSTRPIEEFTDLLKTYSIETVVDVRQIAKSRANPQYWGDALAAHLEPHGIGYVHLEGLGGRRRPSRHSINTGWRNQSFRAYADHMQSAEFLDDLARLIALAERQTVVMMCAEAVPWRCHRSLIGDALLVRGIDVRDIMTEKRATPHELTRFAQVDGTTITYPEDGSETTGATPDA